MKRRELRAIEACYPELLQLAVSEAPREICGLIEWDGARMTLIPVENVAEEPETSFLLDHQAYVDSLIVCEARGTEFWGVFHSHTHEGPTPSARDIAFADTLPSLHWLIVGLEPEPAYWLGVL